MATEKKPVRRNDVVHCDVCGEDYSVTYKRCPFCDDAAYRARGGSGRRVAGNARGGGYGGRVYPIQIVGLVLSLVLIIAAVFIVFTRLAPLFGKDKPKEPDTSAPGTSTSQPVDPDVSAPDASSGDISSPDGSDPAGSQVTPPPAASVAALSLNQSDFTLKANESYPIVATVDPAGTTVVWSTSNEKVATIAQDGRVTNVNTGANTTTVTITATAGDKTATCVVRCRGGSTGTNAGGTTTPPTTPTPPATGGGTLAAGSKGVISGAGGGLNVRSGPGTGNAAIATITNGAAVTIVEDAGGGWYKITFSGTAGKATEGYVSKDYVTAAP